MTPITPAYMTPIIPISAFTKIKQNLCGSFGIMMCLCLICYHAGRFLGLFDPTVYYIIPSGVCEVVAYLLLYSLASNLASEIFAMAQMTIEVFFAIAVPFMVTHMGQTQSLDQWIYIALLSFCALSLFFWIVLFNNNKFNRRDLLWIMLLPLLQALELCIYLSYLRDLQGQNQIAMNGFYIPTYLRIIKMALVALLPISWWKISHSSAFSGNNDGLSLPSLSVWNRYGLICALMIAAAVLLS